MAEPAGGIHINQISGGQLAIGDNASFTQINNYGGSREEAELRDILIRLRQSLPDFADQAAADKQIVIVEQALARRGTADVDVRPVVRGALERLAGQVTAGASLAGAIERAVQLVVQHWPF